MEAHLPHILSAFWASFASVLGGIGSCGGWVVDSGAVIHDMFGCLFPNFAFTTDGVYCAPYFVLQVLEIWVMVTSQLTHGHLLFP